MKKPHLRILTLAFIAFTFITSHAQTIEMSMVPDSSSSLELDYNKLLISDSDLSFISGNFNLQLKKAHSSSLNFIAEANFSHYGDDSDSENGISNIYLGVQLKQKQTASTKSAINIGAYIPTGSDNLAFGAFTNLFDPIKFFQDYTGLSLSYNSFHYNTSGLRLGFEIGADFALPIKNTDFHDSELFGKYGGSILYATNSGFYAQAELLGVLNVTKEEGATFGDASFHTYSVGVGNKWSTFDIGLYFQNYFDDLFSDDLNGIFGVELAKRL